LLGLDVDRLVDQNISFVKLNVDMISKEMQEVEKRGRLKKLKTMLETSGITVIMEKIENERQLLPLVDLYVDYAQGYLFGKPEDVA
jgi:cyclic-di-GMP phosphodiesterase TipF (flagellum assembly factor)